MDVHLLQLVLGTHVGLHIQPFEMSQVCMPVSAGHQIVSSLLTWCQELQAAFKSYCASRISIQKGRCLSVTNSPLLPFLIFAVNFSRVP